MSDLISNPIWRLTMDVLTIIGGFAAIPITIGLVKNHNRHFVILCIPLIIIMSGFGMSKLFGFIENGVLFGIWGAILALLSYVLPASIVALYRANAKLLSGTLLLLYLPVFFLSTTFLFAAVFSCLASRQAPNPPDVILWILFSIVEIVFILGIVYLFRVQPKNLRQ